MIAEAPVTNYEPRGVVKDLFTCKTKQILLEGPAGTGKSRGILEKINLLCLKYPGIRCLLLRKTRSSMTESVLVTYESAVLLDNPAIYPATRNMLRRIRPSYDYPNGSTVVVGGLDNVDRVMSTDYDFIAVFEATEIEEHEWETLMSRLRNYVMPYQQMIADCNPGGPGHWLNKRPNNGKMLRLLSKHEDNPKYYTRKGKLTPEGADYMETLDQLTGHRYLRLRKGLWVAAEGIVYEDYRASVHVVRRTKELMAQVATWRKFRSVDFGYVDPFVCQWWAVDPFGRMYRYRELYHTGILTEDQARLIRKVSGGENIEFTVADHDRQERETYHRHGVSTVPAYKAIIPGIDAVASRLSHKNNADKLPRLFLIEDSLVERDQALFDKKKPTCTEDEWDNYIWKKTKEGQPSKEEPVDENNHGMDATRYATAAADDLAGSEIELIGEATVSV